MSETPTTPAGPWARLGPRNRLVAAALVAVVVVALVVWAVVRAGAGEPGAAASPTASPTASPSVSPSASQSPVVAGATTEGSEEAATAAPDAAAPVDAPPAAAPSPSTVSSAVGETAEVAPRVTVTVDALEAIQGDGDGPGEIDGPSVRFTVRVANGSDAGLSLVGAVVNAYFGEAQTPGIQLSGSGSSPLPSSVAARADVTGTYVFLLPAGATTTRVEVYSVPGAAVLDSTAPTPS
ncbi:hypothetical protein ACWFNE_18160 [Cellulomonas sp. NPDC055163]